MRVFLFFLLFGVMMVGVTLPATSYGWEFGGFVPGDVFEYFICDGHTFDTNTSLRSKCYDLELHVIDNFEMDFGNVWLLYVEVIEDGELMRDIIIVDESFNVDSLNYRYIGNSIENTLFWMPTHADMTSIDLELGNIISDTPGIYENAIVTDFSREFESIQYTISSDSGDTIILREDLYLPIAIDMDTKIFSFNVQLNSMYNKLSFGSVRIGDYVDLDYPAIISDGLYNDTIPINDIREDDLDYPNIIESDIIHSDVINDVNLDYPAIISDGLYNDTIPINDIHEDNDEIIEIPVDDSQDTLLVQNPGVTNLNESSDNDDDLFGWLGDIISSLFESLF